MTKTMQELDVAFRLLSTIAVRGDDVESMAVAKSKIKMVFLELEKQNHEQEKEAEKDG